MARTPNSVETVQITLSTTSQVKELLERLTATGFYGKNVAETVNQLLGEQLREIVKEGKLPSVDALN